MRHLSPFFLVGLVFSVMHVASAQDAGMISPKSIVAGSAFAIQSTGAGSATLYIVGPAQVLRRSLVLGATANFPPGSLYNAGHYLVVLATSASRRTASLNVLPQSEPAKISFLAEPSRLPVSLHNAITGTAYVFDAYRNLIDAPTPVSFELSSPTSAVQVHSAVTRDGAAWTEMDSTSQEGVDHFMTRTGPVSVVRQIRQVPGDPCALTMSAQQSGNLLQLETAPVHDCSGNLAADGTVVSFTESYDGGVSTADVPLKHGIAKVEMPARNGAMLSVASGVVLGNQIRWER